MTVCSGSSDLPGHMMPIGSHRPPLEIDTLQTVPDPLFFYHNYVKPKKPVKFVGLLKDNEVLPRWQDDNYLRYRIHTRIHTEFVGGRI